MAQVLGPDGAPVKRVETDFVGASVHHKAMRLWQPRLSRIEETIQEKGAIEARVLDVYRNNPNVAGAVRAQVDNIVGAKFRLALRPDNRKLDLSREEQKEWVKQVECEWDAYANNPECWIDARRERTFTDLIRMAVSQDTFHGEFLASKEWVTSPIGYKTCFQVIDPVRLCNPDDADLRYEFGIRRTRMGFATHYGVETKRSRNGVIEDPTIRVIPKYNSFGWLQFIHVYDPIRPDQGRGISRLAASLRDVKQLDRYKEAELEQAILSTLYALFIKSEMPDIDRIFGQGDLTPEFKTMLEARESKSGTTPISTNGVQIPRLFPGEEIGSVNMSHPNKSYDAFLTANMRGIAKAMGASYEDFSGDFSRTSYSSARASMIAADKFYGSKRESIASRAATLMFQIWLDEAVDRGRVTPPRDYWPNRYALSRCTWIAGGKGHIDDLKTARARDVNLRNGVQTHQEIAMEDGLDWEDRFEQRRIEAEAKIEIIEQMGVSVPDKLKAEMILSDLNGDPFVKFSDELEREDQLLADQQE